MNIDDLAKQLAELKYGTGSAWATMGKQDKDALRAKAQSMVVVSPLEQEVAQSIPNTNIPIQAEPKIDSWRIAADYELDELWKHVDRLEEMIKSLHGKVIDI